LQKEDDSILTECLKWQLRWESRISSSKRSWGKQLKKWLSLTGDEDLLSLPYKELKQQLPLQLHSIIGKLGYFLLNKDTARMKNSTWTSSYSPIKSHATTEDYLTHNFPLIQTQTLAQTRVNLHRILYKDKYAPLQSKGPCPWCGDEGDLHHYFFECPQLQQQQSILIAALNINNSLPNNFTDLYNNYYKSPNFCKLIFLFWSSAFSKISVQNS
jgi:hypothetical protein